MRVLILHSHISPDAPPDEQDTMAQVASVKDALAARGHEGAAAAFQPDPFYLEALLRGAEADLVFNLVESVWGKGVYAPLAAQMLAGAGIAYTGSDASVMAASNDKLLSKRMMVAAGLPTPAWGEAPDWNGIGPSGQWIVKSVDEDASLGLDDGAVVTGRAQVLARAAQSAGLHGGKWFAESFVDGREFNVAVLEKDGKPFVLPIAEMHFEHWQADRPRIVGYAAKWDQAAPENYNTVRDFSWSKAEPALEAELTRLAVRCWNLFGCRGYARVDFRVDGEGKPYILELNVNPCLEPEAGFAAAAAKAGLSYDELIEHICSVAA